MIIIESVKEKCLLWNILWQTMVWFDGSQKFNSYIIMSPLGTGQTCRTSYIKISDENSYVGLKKITS